MGGIFSVDGKFAQWMGKLADIVILNVLLVVCSIPVVTAGASATAFYYVMLKVVKNEESYVFRSFFKAFKENFRQSTIVFLIVLAATVILGFDLYFAAYTKQGGGVGSPLFLIFCVLALFLYMWSGYLFPLMAFFENSTKGVFRNAALMAMAHFPYTILIAVVNFFPWFVLLFVEFTKAFFFDLIIGFSLAGYVNAKLFRRIFERYIPE